MRSSFQTFLLIIVFILVLAGCSTFGRSRANRYGAFLQASGESFEMEAVLGWYDPEELSEMPVISDPRPTIILIAPQFNYQLIFYDHSANTQRGFNHQPAGENTLEITPLDDLEPGVYCLTLGNITLTAMKMPSWCFSVDGGI